MSLIVCSESECIDKILEDYNENVLSKKRTSKDRTLKEDYYVWANQKYQALVKMLSNQKNSQLVYKALNFITYLDSSNEMDFLQPIQYRSGEKCAIIMVLRRSLLIIDGY